MHAAATSASLLAEKGVLLLLLVVKVAAAVVVLLLVLLTSALSMPLLMLSAVLVSLASAASATASDMLSCQVCCAVQSADRERNRIGARMASKRAAAALHNARLLQKICRPRLLPRRFGGVTSASHPPPKTAHPHSKVAQTLSANGAAKMRVERIQAGMKTKKA